MAGQPQALILFERIRAGFADGRYAPGDYLDPAALAQAFGAAPADVCLALAALLGAGLIEDDGRQPSQAAAFRRLRRDLQHGRYRPGERLDPMALPQMADGDPRELECVLYQLLGEAVIEHHGVDGFRVPWSTEQTLCDQYECLQRTLTWACDRLADPDRRQKKPLPRTDADDDEQADVAVQTVALFESIADRSGFKPLSECVSRMCCLIGPARPAEAALITDATAEITGIRRLWQAMQWDALKWALFDYHRRRKRLAPRIVALLSESAGAAHC